MDGTQVASLFGILSLDDKMTPALKKSQAAIKDTKSGFGDLGSSLRGFGAQATGMLTLPIVGGLALAIKAASDTQSALAQLDQELSVTGDSTTAAAATQGHWATATEASGAKADKMRGQLETLTARLHDHEAAQAHAKHPTEAMGVTIDQEKEQISRLTAELGINTAGTKVWVTGHADVNTITHMTRDALIKLADGFSQETRYSKDSVIGAESLLLTFRSIGKDVFPETTQAVLDMSTAMGQDLKSSSVQLGKALEDPIKGISALSRIGVSFNETQKETIKQMMKLGDVAGAQKVILGEVEHEFGGTAQAAGSTFAGQLDIANHAVQGLLEAVGMQLLPVLTGLATGIGSVVRWLTDNLSPGVIQAGIVFAGLVAAIGPVATILGSIGAVIGIVLSPIGLVVGAVIGLAAAFATNFGGIRDTVNSIWYTVKPTLEKFKDIASGFMKDLFPDNSNQQATQTVTVSQRVNRGMKSEDGDPAAAQQKIQKTYQSDPGPGFGDNLIKAINNALPKVQDALSGLVTDAGKWITDTGFPAFKTAMAGLFGIDPGIFDTIKTTFGQIWRLQVQPALDSVSSGISTFVKNFSGADVSGIGVILKDLATGIGVIVGAVVSVGLAIFKGIGDALGPMGSALKSFVNAISDVGNGDIGKFFSDMGDGLGNLVKAIATVPLSAATQLGGLIGIDVKGGLASWGTFKDQISDIWNGLFVGDGSVLGRAIIAGKAWVQDIKDKFTEIQGAITTAFAGVAEIITAPFRSAIRAIGQLLSSIGGLGGMFTELKTDGQNLIDFAGPKAAGGPVSGGSAYLVGEQGPELFVPGTSGSIIPNGGSGGHSFGGGGGGGTVINITNPVFQGVSDIGAFYDQLSHEAGRRNMVLGGRA